MDVNNTERPNNLKLFSNGISLKGRSVLRHILRDYINKTEAMPRGCWGGRKKKQWKAQAIEGPSKRSKTNYLGKKPG